MLALSLVGLILIQHGKGASAGAGFGSGAAGAVFGARGAHSFLYKLTAGIATAFFITSLALAYLATSETTVDSSQSIMTQTTVEDSAQIDLPQTSGSESDVPEN